VILGVGGGADVPYTEFTCDDCQKRTECPHAVKPAAHLKAVRWASYEGGRHRCVDCEEKLYGPSFWRAEAATVFATGTAAASERKGYGDDGGG